MSAGTSSTLLKAPEKQIAQPGAKTELSIWTRLLPFAIVFLAACAIYFTDLGKHPLFNPDEALYAEPAREMLETGEYVTTLLNYVVRFTKPPVVIWAMAFNYQIFGVCEFAARFFGAASAAILVAAVYWFAEKYFNRRTAFFASFALMTAPLFIGTGRTAITDMPLSLFMAGSLLAFYHGYRQQQGRWRWLAYALVGLAIMTKGPVGLVLPIAVLAAFHVLRGDWKEAIAYYKPLPGLLLTALIAVPWFAVEIYVTKGAYYNEFILRENFQRFTSVVDHKAPWWYHIAAMFGGLFPWTMFLPSAVFGALKAGGADGKKFLPLGWWTRYRNLNEQQSLLLYASLWAILILGFFSVSVSKLLPYTVPAFPAIALLVGVQLDRLCESQSRRGLKYAFAGLAVIYAAAIVIMPLFSGKLRDCPPELLTVIPAFLAVQAVIAAVAWLSMMRGRASFAVKFFAMVTCFAIVSFGPHVLDVVSDEWDEPITAFAHYAAASDWPIVVFGMRAPSVPFYTHRRVLLPKSSDELVAQLKTLDHAYILTRSRNAKDLATLRGTDEVVTRGRYTLSAWRKPTTVQ